MARVMFADGADVIDKELARVGQVVRGLDPGGYGLMPAEIMAAHEHVVGFGKAEEKIRAGKIVYIGSRTECDPFQFIGRYDDDALLAYEIGEIGVALHVANYDRGAERQAMAGARVPGANAIRQHHGMSLGERVGLGTGFAQP